MSPAEREEVAARARGKRAQDARRKAFNEMLTAIEHAIACYEDPNEMVRTGAGGFEILDEIIPVLELAKKKASAARAACNKPGASK
jgi:hypothetical protein